MIDADRTCERMIRSQRPKVIGKLLAQLARLGSFESTCWSMPRIEAGRLRMFGWQVAVTKSRAYQAPSAMADIELARLRCTPMEL